ncbi:cyclic-di-AMP-binding protein CbpB [Alteribacillus iranensis]|uniref:Predicted transcriptional regulator with C-terminal CBS domains n=1 Tax=Alteribacillus iranensis TaxID=930128 RepID=A0A1I2AD24_9BACI|nr:cyclic-di-AMP-binding protein CbpB [Alteribacillus iranensis]SFE41905.1 Predicted transcriptional regulator with C-terminal CBS domains [Alteribacillus iranensis]
MLLQALKDSQIMDNEIKKLMIPHEKVAHVQSNNPLDHALLVLIKSGYTAIPVLDTDYKVQGQISKAQILDSILGIERIEMERLHDYKVDEVMSNKVPRMNQNETFGKALMLSINHPFVCIEDDEQSFIGIMTRRSILALIHRHLGK